jgi:hypothetical protein
MTIELYGGMTVRWKQHRNIALLMLYLASLMTIYKKYRKTHKMEVKTTYFHYLILMEL